MHTRAFSLIELLVVIAIIMILSVSVLASIRPSSDQARMDEVANDVVSLLRTARQNSMTVLEHPTVSNMFPNYGVHFNAHNSHGNEIIMYVICRADNQIPNGSLTLADHLHLHNETGDCSGNNVIETMRLKHGIRVRNITYEPGVGGGTRNFSHFNILFVSPEPTVWYSGRDDGAAASMATASHEGLDVGTVRITIRNTQNTLSRVISVNSVGLVTIEH
jgi:type II secretory pathway pseudopilin PulG